MWHFLSIMWWKIQSSLHFWRKHGMKAKSEFPIFFYLKWLDEFSGWLFWVTFSWSCPRNACMMSRSMRFHSRIFMIAIHDFYDFIFFRSLTFGFKQSINSRCLSWIIFMPRNNLTQLYKIISNFPKIKHDLGSTGHSFIRSVFLGFLTSYHYGYFWL